MLDMAFVLHLVLELSAYIIPTLVQVEHLWSKIQSAPKSEAFLSANMTPQWKISQQETLFHAQNYLKYYIKLLSGYVYEGTNESNQFHV